MVLIVFPSGCGVLQNSMVPWHGMAWHGMTWHGTSWHGAARHDRAVPWPTVDPCPHPVLLVLSPAVLLAKAAKQWQQEHGGALPSSTAERNAFKELLKGWQRDINGIPLEAGFGGRVGMVVRSAVLV